MKKATRKQLIREHKTVKVVVVTLPTADLAMVRGGDSFPKELHYPSGGE
jgi:hypothetical protein